VLEIPLDRLQAIKTALGVTINDVVLTALAAALGDYHRQRHVRVGRLNCMVPMNLRGRDQHDALGNRVGMCTVVLPLGEMPPRRRLERIVAQTRRAKSDRRGRLYPVLLESLAVIPGAALGWLARQSLERVNLACTNIPGVGERRYIGGAEITALYPFASVVQGTPLVVALVSYAGTMEIGLDTDPEAIPNPVQIADLFQAALDELLSA